MGSDTPTPWYCHLSPAAAPRASPAGASHLKVSPSSCRAGIRPRHTLGTGSSEAHTQKANKQGRGPAAHPALGHCRGVVLGLHALLAPSVVRGSRVPHLRHQELTGSPWGLHCSPAHPLQSRKQKQCRGIRTSRGTAPCSPQDRAPSAPQPGTGHPEPPTALPRVTGSVPSQQHHGQEGAACGCGEIPDLSHKPGRSHARGQRGRCQGMAGARAWQGGFEETHWVWGHPL